MRRLENYRKLLADEVRALPSHDKKMEKIKDEKANGPDYWLARKSKVEVFQPEQSVDAGLGLFLKKKTLYHGSNVPSIGELKLQEKELLVMVYT